MLRPFLLGVDKKLVIILHNLLRLYCLDLLIDFEPVSVEEFLLHFQFTVKLLLLLLFIRFFLVPFVFESEEFLAAIQLVDYALSRGELVTYFMGARLT